MRRVDELEEGQNITDPYIEVFEDYEAEALRCYFIEKCPDLLQE
jgi:hypothetical protein